MRGPLAALLLAAEAAALAFGVRGWWLYRNWNLHDPEGFFSIVWLTPSLLAIAAIAGLLARRNGAAFEARANLPLLSLLLQPLKTHFFLTNSEILPTLPFALAASLALRCVLSGRLPGRAYARSLVDRFAAWSPLRQSVVVFAIALLIYLFLASSLLFPVYPFTGDEPHYLIITHSIVHDGDINLYDNYYVNRDYQLFYAGELEAHTHAKDRDRRQSYSNHMPGASIALAPFYWLSSGLPPPVMLFILRAGMCFFTAILVAQAYLLMHRIFRDPRIALAGTAFLALSPPLVFYSRCVYPEVFAGLLMVAALRIILDERPATSYLTASVALAAMPWFGTKYAIFAVGFTLAYAALRWRAGNRRVTTYVVFLIPLILSAASLLLYLKHYYGEYSPEAIYHPAWNRPEEAALSLADRVFGPVRALLGYFYDQRIGLIVFSPAFLLAFPGFVLLYRKHRLHALVVAAIATFYIVFYAYNMSWGGQAPPGRPLVSITPLLAVMVAAFLAWSQGAWKILRAALLVLTAVITLVLLENSYLLYDTVSNHNWQGRSLFLTFLSNPFLNLTRFVPQFLERETFNYAAACFWLAVFVLIMGLFFRHPRKPDLDPIIRGRVTTVLLTSGALLLALLNLLEPGFVIWGPAERLPAALIHRMDSRSYPPEAGGFWTRGGRTTSVLVESERALSGLRVTLSSVSSNRVRLLAYNRPLLSDVELRQGLRVDVPLPWEYVWGHKMLYVLTVNSRRAIPQQESRDPRPLGVMVRIDPIER